MRLIYTVNDLAKAQKLSTFLISERIDNKLEVSTNTDWGSPNYGDATCRIWVYDEDFLEPAMRWVQEFEKDPNQSIFEKKAKPLVFPSIAARSSQEAQPKSARGTPPRKQGEELRPEPMGRITMGFLLVCCLLFILSTLTAPWITPLPDNFPYAPLASSPVKKQLLYDYPQAFELVDKLVKLYGVERLRTPQDLPREGIYLLTQFQKTPYWDGFYDIVVNKIKKTEPPQPLPPMFEKIRQGEVWRTFTPALLHNDILHLVFNMIWLIILGKQIEQRLRPARYLILILALGVFSNTCQYLMSGPNFLGFSGILCGMLTFIWVRQKIAPWEGYPLQKATIVFLMYFILAMFAIQLVSFYNEVTGESTTSPGGIANTAHLSGALFGAVLGYLPFFSWKAVK